MERDSLIRETFRTAGSCVERYAESGSLSSASTLQIESDVDRSLLPSHIWWHEILRGQRPVSNQIDSDSVRVADLFCGTGGLSLGATLAIEALGRRANLEVAVDVDLGALGVYLRNLSPKSCVRADVAGLVDYHVYGRGEDAEAAYEPEIIGTAFEGYVNRIDLLLAGPPCQGHSNLNNHTRRSDPRNQLYVTTAAMAIALKTKMLVIENVADVLRDKTEVVATAKKILQDAGYYVSQGIINASEVGGAQSRRRHFTIATLIPHTPIADAKRLLRRDSMPLRGAIGDLESSVNTDFMNSEPTLSSENRARIKHLFDYDLYDLPNDIRPDSHKDGHTYPSVYGRLDWDKPAQTITTGFMSPGRGRYIHPSQQRVITAREAARIQGFPDWFTFSENGEPPSKKLLSKWIGDAVPTQLGYAAVLMAMSGLTGD